MSLFSQNWPFSEEEEELEVPEKSKKRRKVSTETRARVSEARLTEKQRMVLEDEVRPLGYTYEEAHARKHRFSKSNLFPIQRLDIHVETMIKRKHKDAKAEFERVMQNEPENSPLYRQLMMRVFDQGDDRLEEYLALHPSQHLMYLLGHRSGAEQAQELIALELERLEEAKEREREATQLTQGTTPEKKPDVNYEAMMMFWSAIAAYQCKEKRSRVVQKMRVAAGQSAKVQAVGVVSLDRQTMTHSPTLAAMNAVMLCEQRGAISNAVDVLSRCCSEYEDDPVIWSHLSRLLLENPELEHKSIVQPAQKIHRKQLDIDATCLPALYWVVNNCSPAVATIHTLKTLMELRQQEPLWEMLLQLCSGDKKDDDDDDDDDEDWEFEGAEAVTIRTLCNHFERDIECNPDGIQQRAIEGVLSKVPAD